MFMLKENQNQKKYWKKKLIILYLTIILSLHIMKLKELLKIYKNLRKS